MIITADDFCSLLKKSAQFDDLEIKILRAMLELWQRKQLKATASTIAREAKISVTNAYKYLYTLQNKGLIESSENKNKIFWLARSTNPFPRLFSYIGKDYLAKKKLFGQLEELYGKFLPLDKVWGGEKFYEHYSKGFSSKAALLFDVAREEILITTTKFFDDFILLDALKRAITRGVKIRAVAEQIHPDLTKKLREINVDLRLGYAWPYMIVVDGVHGLSVDNEQKGIFFFNYKTDYKERFEKMWSEAEKI